MKVNFRQIALATALGLPLALAIATTSPFQIDTRAQGASHMLGPNFPVRLDTNGDGQPGSGDDGIVPTRSGNTMTIPSRWQCGSASTNNVIELTDRDGSGRYRTANREVNGHVQSITVASNARAFSYQETEAGTEVARASVTLVDRNNDGVLDGASIGGTVTASVSFAFAGNNDYVTIPWSQASVLGFDASQTCAGPLPQVFIPLADTNGDGRGDSIVLDLDGNGQADADVYASPAISVPSVPTMGPAGRLILLLLVGLTGAWFLSRRQAGNTGTPAAI